MIHRIFCKIRKYIPVVPRVFFASAFVLALVHAAFGASEGFADLFNRTVAAACRFLLAKVTGFFPFSLAECVLLFSPVILISVIVLTVRRTRESPVKGMRCVVSFVSVATLIYSLFVLTLAPGYSAPGTDRKLGIERRPVSAQELCDAALYLSDKLNETAQDVAFEEGSSSVMPYSNSDMNAKLNEAYAKFAGEHDLFVNFSSGVKQIALSEPMTYTHISGVYSFFTGEANLNVNYPDYILPYTAAHEMAHQRGIAREDEANFIAYLVCSGSDDHFIRYSAYLNMFEYVSDALYSADRDEYIRVYSGLADEVRDDLNAYSRFFDKYRDSAASQVSGAVNDAYLTIQGAGGAKSYGMVTDLFVAMLEDGGFE